MVNMPLGQFLRLARIGLVALRFCDQRLVIDYILRMPRQDEQVIKRCRRQTHHTVLNDDSAGIEIQRENAALEKAIGCSLRRRSICRGCSHVVEGIQFRL